MLFCDACDVFLVSRRLVFSSVVTVSGFVLRKSFPTWKWDKCSPLLASILLYGFIFSTYSRGEECGYWSQTVWDKPSLPPPQQSVWFLARHLTSLHLHFLMCYHDGYNSTNLKGWLWGLNLSTLFNASCTINPRSISDIIIYLFHRYRTHVRLCDDDAVSNWAGRGWRENGLISH